MRFFRNTYRSSELLASIPFKMPCHSKKFKEKIIMFIKIWLYQNMVIKIWLYQNMVIKISLSKNN